VLRSIALYREHGILDNYDYYAVGNLCVENDVEIMYKTLKLVREALPDKKIHVFGLRLNALKKVYWLIDSFDTTAWTRPVDTTLKANYSCKTREERIRFFERWLEKYSNIARNTPLDTFI
jgi:queuine/archaeosine tRNA-ribosyltransferase